MTATATTNVEERSRTYFNDNVAREFAGQLEDGASPLQAEQPINLPYNPASGNSYTGMNALNLLLQDRADDRWMTKDEAKQAGLSPKNGEEATPVRYWRTAADGETRHATLAWLYNGEQLLGMPPMPRKAERPDPTERVLDIIRNSGANVVRDREQSGYYSAKTDTIHLANPDKLGRDAFCEDALYQYFRSLGHHDRLGRESFGAVGASKEAQEAFICTMATMHMCGELGIRVQPERSAHYADMWSQSITNRPINFSQDMAEAEKAVTATLTRELARIKEMNPAETFQWRPVMEETPYGAVKTFLDRKQIMDAMEKNPGELDKFTHEGKEIFSLAQSGNLLARKPLNPDRPEDGVALLIKTHGFDRDGNPHDLTITYNVKLDENGLSERTSEAEARRIVETQKSMSLPRDWNGELTVHGCVENSDGEIEKSNAPTFYSVMAKTEEGKSEFVASFNSQRDAQKYVYQALRQYEYLGTKLGLDVDFERLKNPDRPMAQTAGQNRSSRGGGNNAAAIDSMEETRRLCIRTMESIGLVVSGKHPIIDGAGHRIAVAGGKEGNLDGWYVAHSDRTPGGTCINHVTKARADWSTSRGTRLTNTVKEQLTGIAKARKETDKQEQTQANSQAVERLKSMMENVFTKPDGVTPYLEAKGLPHDPGIFQNKGSTCIPIMDVKGTVHSMAYVKEDGAKRYAKGGDKAGHFYPCGGLGDLKNAPAISICEGYATAATISQATGTCAVAAFDSGNLGPVAAALREAYPDKPIIIFADDDRHLPLQDPPLVNAGREYGQAAAEAVNATVAFPRWDEGTPADKQHTDFDDIRREHGIGEVRSQVLPVIERAIEQARESQRNEQAQEKTRGSLTRN